MPGEVECSKFCATRCRLEFLDGLTQLVATRVLDQLGLQPEGLKACRDVGPIAPDVRQLRFPLLFGVAYHQRNAGSLRLRADCGERQQGTGAADRRPPSDGGARP